MKAPDRYISKSTHSQRLTPSTDGSDGSESIGMSNRQRPCSVATHTQTCDIHAVGINSIFAFDLTEQSSKYGQLVCPKLIFWTLWRDNDKLELLTLLCQPGRTMPHDELQVLAPLACSMQKQHEGPSFQRLNVTRVIV